MKISAKKKDLQTAVTAVETLSAAMSTDGKPPSVIDVVASSKGLTIQFLLGMAVVRATVANAKVEEVGNGGISLLLSALKQSLNANGDMVTLDVPKNGQTVNFTVGRAKGVLALTSSSLDADAFEGKRPKTSISISNFSTALKSTLIKGSTPQDRTFHIDAKKKTLLVEATDEYRALLTEIRTSEDSTFPGTSSITLQSKALNVLSDLFKGDIVLFGFDGNVTTFRTNTVYVCLPQQSSPPLTLSSDTAEAIAASGEVLAEMTLTSKALKDAFSDATALIDDKAMGKLTIDAQVEAGSFLGTSDGGSITSPFSYEVAPARPVLFSLVASFVKDALSMYEAGFTLKVYSETILLERVGENDNVLRQTTMLPLLDRAVADAAKKPSKKAEEEDKEEVADPPPKKPKKAKAEPAPEPEPEPTPEPAQEAQEEEFDDDDEE